MLNTKTIATAVAGTALVLSNAARAQDWFQLEAGIGGTAYESPGQGLWWQSGFQHDFNLTAPSIRAGVTGNIWQRSEWGVDYHIDYVWLGTAHTDATVPTPKTNTTSGRWSGADFVDYNAANPCSGPCSNLSDFRTSGHDAGFMLTLEPHYDVGPWRFGVEAGPYIHRSTFAVDVFNWYDSGTDTFHPLHVEHRPTWRVGWTVGASISRGNFSLRYNYFRNGSPSTQDNPYPPGWSGAHVLMAAWRF